MDLDAIMNSLNGPSDIVKTQREIANRWSCHPRTIRKWIDQGMPGERGNYDLQVIAQWREDSLMRKPEDDYNRDSKIYDKPNVKGKTQPNGTMAEHKLRLVAANADKAEADAEIAVLTRDLNSGDYIHIADLNKFLSEFFIELRNQHQKIAVTSAPAFGGKADFFKKYMGETFNQLMVHMKGFTMNTAELITRKVK